MKRVTVKKRKRNVRLRSFFFLLVIFCLDTIKQIKSQFWQFLFGKSHKRKGIYLSPISSRNILKKRHEKIKIDRLFLIFASILRKAKRNEEAYIYLLDDGIPHAPLQPCGRD